jgi:hypothetical protein
MKKSMFVYIAALLTFLHVSLCTRALAHTTVKNNHVEINPGFTRLIFDDEGALPFSTGAASSEEMALSDEKLALLVGPGRLSRSFDGAASNSALSLTRIDSVKDTYRQDRPRGSVSWENSAAETTSPVKMPVPEKQAPIPIVLSAEKVEPPVDQENVAKEKEEVENDEAGSGGAKKTEGHDGEDAGESSASFGLDLFGRTSSQFLWWKDRIDGETRFAAYQYLRFGVLNLVKDGNISVFGYGRFGYNEVADPEANGRLYYFYLDWKDLWSDRLDLRLGRQWTNLVAASTIIDGVQLDFKRIGPVGLVLLGGRDVVFDEFNEDSDSGDTAWGGEVYLQGVRDLKLSLSYAMIYDDGDLARQVAAYDIGYGFMGAYRLYSEARYDIINEQISELTAGFKVFPNDVWTIRGEYFFTYPTFDTTSIYAVFAASSFHAGSLVVDYYPSENFSFYGSITWEYFEINDAENDDAFLYEIGTHFDLVEIRVDGSVVFREGFPGDLIGFSLAATRPFFDGKLDLGAGVDYDIYQRDQMTDDEIATKYWISGRYHFTEKVSFALRVENTESVTQDNNFAGWSSFEISF